MTALEELQKILSEIDGLQVRMTDQDRPKKTPCLTLTPARSVHRPIGLAVDRLERNYTLELLVTTYLGNLPKALNLFENLKNKIRDKVFDNRTLNNQVNDCKITGEDTIVKRGEKSIHLICRFNVRTVEAYTR